MHVLQIGSRINLYRSDDFPNMIVKIKLCYSSLPKPCFPDFFVKKMSYVIVFIVYECAMSLL